MMKKSKYFLLFEYFVLLLILLPTLNCSESVVLGPLYGKECERSYDCRYSLLCLPDVHGDLKCQSGESVCGNGIIEKLEYCDDGNVSPQDGCSPLCEREPGWYCDSSTDPTPCRQNICGDGIVEDDEACDDGNTDLHDGCPSGIHGECQYAVCGDGYVSYDGNSLFETCDDGNLVSGDGCNAQCLTETGYECFGDPSVCRPNCGDGEVVDGVETCDDGNSEINDDCPSGPRGKCQTGVCGDSYLKEFSTTGLAEECDDGNKIAGDGCGSDCQIEQGFTCDGIPSQCQTECGDEIVGGREECDDGDLNTNSNCVGCCRKDCTLQSCGDGIEDTAAGEECDDGNSDNLDGCNTLCERAFSGCIKYVDTSRGSSGDGSGWSTAFNDIQEGIDAAALEGSPNNPCWVWVATGTVNIYQDSPRNTIQLKPGTVLWGGFQTSTEYIEDRDLVNDKTILSGTTGSNSVYHVVTGGSSTRIDGFIIREGHAKGNAATEQVGAGLYLDAVTEFKITNVDIEDSQSVGDGGAIYSMNSAWTASNLSVANNFSNGIGGGVFIQTDDGKKILIEIESSLFQLNEAGLVAGGIYVGDNVSLTLKNSLLDSNKSITGGAVTSNQTSTIEFSNNIFSNNVTGQGVDWGDGGAHYNEGSHGSIANCVFDSNIGAGGGAISNFSQTDVSIKDSIFFENTARSAGGAILNLGATPKISGCIFIGNNAIGTVDASKDTGGGAIANEFVKVNNFLSSTEFFIDNCDFVDNTTAWNGGAIISTNSEININNSRFYHNTANTQGVDNEGGGGALWNEYVKIVIRRSAFVANYANNGGAIANQNLIAAQSKIVNSIFVDNLSKRMGGSLFYNGNSDFNIVNSTIVNNRSQATCVWNANASKYINPVSGGINVRNGSIPTLHGTLLFGNTAAGSGYRNINRMGANGIPDTISGSAPDDTEGDQPAHVFTDASNCLFVANQTGTFELRMFDPERYVTVLYDYDGFWPQGSLIDKVISLGSGNPNDNYIIRHNTPISVEIYGDVAGNAYTIYDYHPRNASQACVDPATISTTSESKDIDLISRHCADGTAGDCEDAGAYEYIHF